MKPVLGGSVLGVTAGVTGAETEAGAGAQLVAEEAGLVVTGSCMPGMGLAGGAVTEMSEMSEGMSAGMSE